ncbi:hypothetical protein SRHO_G00236370 [Serrasalmus rhombeus]
MERDGGSRAEGSGEMEHTHLHLTCLPERYMKAKFSLSAYIFCWAVVKLCQRRLRLSHTAKAQRVCQAESRGTRGVYRG